MPAETRRSFLPRPQWLKTIHAKTHHEALRKASGSLEAEHCDKPIRLEQEESAPPPPPDPAVH